MWLLGGIPSVDLQMKSVPNMKPRKERNKRGIGKCEIRKKVRNRKLRRPGNNKLTTNSVRRLPSS